MYSKSTDYGETWQAPAPVGDTPLVGPPETNVVETLAAPSLAVAADGTVGVAFDDRRRATDDAKRNAIDYWVPPLA